MLLHFFTNLRQAKVPVTLREYLDPSRRAGEGLRQQSVEDFYYLARACLVKDERNLDRFDRVFGHASRGWTARPTRVAGRHARGMAAASWPRNT